jgi:alcohol dehydrogenase class IV
VAAAFPDPAALAGAIEVAVTAGIRFKCTAGLHHALAHQDPATGFCHHGFVNVLLAVHAAQAGSGGTGELLASRDGTALAERARDLQPDEVTTLRAQFCSIGSCSIGEPLADLQALSLVSAA